jgi:nitrogen fixation/metabolism regulation signal transduction histidine kinase
MQEIISKSFPYKLALKSILIITAGAIITGAVFYFAIYEEFGPSYKESLELISNLKQNLLYKTIIIYLATSFFLLGIAFMTLIYSHRVAGPIYRLGLTARTIADGFLRLQVHLREKDVVHPLADSLNNVTRNYSEIVEQLGKEFKELKDISTKINGLTVSGRSKEVQKAVGAASEKVEDINTILSNIKL